MTLTFDRSGSGEPLVLLHALGSSRRSFDPVMPALVERYDVIAVDLPGFGESAPLASDVEPSPAEFARAVGDLLDSLGITVPHLVGNSLGGWIALELANRRPVASVTALAPAGLWRKNTPHYDRASLRLSRFLARWFRPILAMLMRFRIARLVVLGQSHGRPMRMTVEQARHAVNALARCPGFRRAFRATLNRRLVGADGISAPVTVAFGTRDLILLKRQSRHLDQLPRHTELISLPGCGHLSMADAPDRVAAAIRRTAMSARRGTVSAWSRPTTSA